MSRQVQPGKRRETAANMENVRTVRDESDLAGLLNSTKPSAVMFYADWCPDCIRFKPTFEELASQYGRRIAFMSVDVARLPHLEQNYGIALIPTVLLFERSRLSRTWEFVEDIQSYRSHFGQMFPRSR